MLTTLQVTFNVALNPCAVALLLSTAQRVGERREPVAHRSDVLLDAKVMMVDNIVFTFRS